MTVTSHRLLTIGSLHTCGYADSEIDPQIERLMLGQDPTLLLDIRLRPQSRWRPQWNRRNLETRYGQQYQWEPRLGNLHYKHPKQGMQLAPGHEDAVRQVVEMLRAGTSIILLCACKHFDACHRSLVVQRIQDAAQLQ